MKKISKYIPHIDGLRALAILSVVIYHAFPTAITGGFIGVDIFFVISGFQLLDTYINPFINKNFHLKFLWARYDESSLH